MKHLTENLTETTRHIHSTLVEWVLFKVPELFVTIYGK